MAKELPVPLKRRMGGLRSQFGHFGEEIYLLPLQLSELVIQPLS
jgi:hypothetical protein